MQIPISSQSRKFDRVRPTIRFSANNGIAISDFGQGLESFALTLIIQSDNRILVAGESGYRFLVGRYNSNGSLDTSFGNGGFVATNFSSSWDSSKDAVLQPDGKIIL